MALGSSLVWGGKKGFITEIQQEKVRVVRIKIGGTGQAFTTYSTGGVTLDICGTWGFTENDTSVILDPDATYRYVYDKANNKIMFLTTTTGAQLAGSTDISTKEVYGTLIGK